MVQPSYDEDFERLSHEQLRVLFDAAVLTRRLVRSNEPLVAVLDRVKRELDANADIDHATAALMITYLAEMAVREAVRIARHTNAPAGRG